jgi:hypothetical protein
MKIDQIVKRLEFHLKTKLSDSAKEALSEDKALSVLARVEEQSHYNYTTKKEAVRRYNSILKMHLDKGYIPMLGKITGKDKPVYYISGVAPAMVSFLKETGMAVARPIMIEREG